MLKGHGGNVREAALRLGLSPDAITDFSASVCSFPGDGPRVAEWTAEALKAAARYPDPEYWELREAIARRHNLRPDRVIAGNGSTELLYLIPRAIRSKRAVVVSPSYADYADAPRLAGAEVTRFFLSPDNGFALDPSALSAGLGDEAVTVYLGNPNNPTGNAFPRHLLRELCARHKRALFVVDESFADFSPDTSLLPDVPDNAIVVKSLTKFYGIPGIRLGFCAASPENIDRLTAHKEPWTVNCVAERIGVRLMERGLDDAARLAEVEGERAFLFEDLSRIPGISLCPSAANFFLVRINAASLNAPALRERLLQKSLLVRDCSNFAGLDGQWIRIAVRGRDDNRRLVEALGELC